MANFAQLGLQDSNSISIGLLSSFHDHIIVLLSGIISFVFLIIIRLITIKYTSRNLLEAQTLELIWTIVPVFLLLILAIPSLRLLYIIEELNNPILTLKAIGHQWYWEYEYSDLNKSIQFDRYIKPESELNLGDFRLLEVDNRVILPINREIRVIVTARDVLHSWTIPSLGVKADAIPGRLNQLSINANKPRVLYGQCSEICGANHRFIPIVLEFISWNDFKNWYNNQ